MKQDAAAALVVALERLTDLELEASKRLQESRQHADLVRKMTPAELADSLRNRSGQSQFDARRTEEQERAVLDAFEALMHLCADESTRLPALSVFADLRARREIGIATLPGTDAAEDLFHLDSKPSREEARAGFFKMMDKVAEWAKSREQRWNVVIAESDRLLASALEKARAIASQSSE